MQIYVQKQSIVYVMFGEFNYILEVINTTQPLNSLLKQFYFASYPVYKIT